MSDRARGWAPAGSATQLPVDHFRQGVHAGGPARKAQGTLGSPLCCTTASHCQAVVITGKPENTPEWSSPKNPQKQQMPWRVVAAGITDSWAPGPWEGQEGPPLREGDWGGQVALWGTEQAEHRAASSAEALPPPHIPGEASCGPDTSDHKPI